MSRTKTPQLDLERVRVGETLRSLREKSGYRADEFATALGISRPYYSNIEAGRKPLTKILLARAAKLLDVPQVAIVRYDHYEKGRAS